MSGVIAKDVPVFLSHLGDMSAKLEMVKENVMSMHHHIGDASALPSRSEIDILNLKNQLLLSYILDLGHVILLKCEGRSCNIANDASTRQSSLDRLLEIRTILEKMRPLERRFSYQLDKLLRTASTSGGEHPLQFKPAPENLISKSASGRERDGGEEDSSDEELSDGKAAGPGVYVPPRVVAVPYSEEKKDSRSLPKSQSGKTKLIRELRDEVTDFPTEIQSFDGGVREGAMARQDRLKESYEEDNMVRLARKRSNKARTRDVEDIMDFSLFQGLTGQAKRKKGNAVQKKRTKQKTNV